MFLAPTFSQDPGPNTKYINSTEIMNIEHSNWDFQLGNSSRWLRDMIAELQLHDEDNSTQMDKTESTETILQVC